MRLWRRRVNDVDEEIATLALQLALLRIHRLTASTPITVVSVALLLAMGGLAAASIPAARAASIDPVEALRAE
jgi:ABC-type lipoprotein release transport system permease subunit